VAEFVGAFALVFVGVGSVIYGELVGVALANAFVAAVMVTAAGPGTGYFNPAVTIALFLTRRLPARLTGLYLLMQLGAAALATLFLKWVLPDAAESGTHLGAPVLGTGITSGKAVAIEAALTFLLVFVIFAVVFDPRSMVRQVSGVVIGLTVGGAMLMGVGLTGSELNPARAFGSQLVGNHWSHFWVWYVGPIAGAAIAALFYEGAYLSPAGPKREEQPPADEPSSGTAAFE
jgi:aquaporin Z